MISLDDVQEALIAKLKANTALVAYLTTQAATNEIREAQWQGDEFALPAVRVNLGLGTPGGDGPCANKHTTVEILIACISDEDSSAQADQLTGLVNDALLDTDVRLSGAGWLSAPIVFNGVTGALHQEDRTWRAFSTFSVLVYERRS